MDKPKLYFDVKKLTENSQELFYKTDKIKDDWNGLEKHSTIINQQDAILTYNNNSKINLLYRLNKVEYSILLKVIKECKDNIDEITKTDPNSGNNAMVLLWGKKELKKQFIEWFNENGFKIPKKVK